MQNKAIPVTRSSMPPIEEYIREIQPIWDSARLTNMGPLHQQFEKAAADYLAVDNISLFANGHLALEIAIQSLGLTGEVITTPFTFVSTTHAIRRNNLQPVFCDIDPEDCTIDVSLLERLISEKTSAIIPVHVYGNICDTAAIESIAKKYHLKVIYDAAHCFGIKVNDRGIGTFGDISMFSFHATKVFHTIEGGALTYGKASYKVNLEHLKNFGFTSPELVEAVGTNAKMNEFQAAMGLCNLRHLDEEIVKRKAVAERYRQNLAGIKGIKLLPEKRGIRQNYAYFPVFFEPIIFGKTRNQVFADLAINNIIARKYFYPLITDLQCYRGIYSITDTPVARTMADQVMTLPMYADLDLKEVDRICGYILA